MNTMADFDAIQVGDRRELTKRITEDDIRRFVEMTGDDNPLHVDPAFAAGTSFKDIVVHGMLGASFISTVIGTQLPGPGALWVSQAMDFLLPVRLGDVLTIACTVTKKSERERLLDLDTRIHNQHGQLVLQGQGKVKVLEGRLAQEQTDARGTLQPTAIVTGGSGGIGAAICRQLAARGHKVVLNFHSGEERARRIVDDLIKSGHAAVAVQADVSTDRGARALYDKAVATFGAPGVLVNNASPRVHAKALGALGWGDFQRHLDVQLQAAFHLTQLVAPAMSARRAGRIVNITSQVIQGAPSLHWTSYAVAKAALAAFSRNIAAELGPSGITVNCVSPGMTDTAMIGDIAEKHQMMIARQTPLRRLATPEDVASAVGFLVSDDARFVTAHTLNVNGGMVPT